MSADEYEDFGEPLFPRSAPHGPLTTPSTSTPTAHAPHISKETVEAHLDIYDDLYAPEPHIPGTDPTPTRTSTAPAHAHALIPLGTALDRHRAD